MCAEISCLIFVSLLEWWLLPARCSTLLSVKFQLIFLPPHGVITQKIKRIVYKPFWKCKHLILWILGLEFQTCLFSFHSFISIQPWRPGLAGTRAQSCDRYGSGTLHPVQVLGGSLPLLSPAFRRSHFSRQVPPSATTREILAACWGSFSP